METCVGMAYRWALILEEVDEEADEEVDEGADEELDDGADEELDDDVVEDVVE
jgi:hypothetical protein